MSDWPLEKMQKVASEKFSLNNISKEFFGRFIHSSLSFESDFLTIEDVYNILDGKFDNIDEKIIRIVLNHKRAFLFVIEMLKENEVLDENKLKDIHEILLEGMTIGGLYRNVDISVKGSNHTPPSHIKVYDRMKKYFNTIESYENNVFEQAAFSLLQLSKIHPFLDGNARLARIILNYFLIKNGLAPIILPHTERFTYFKLLEEFKVEKNMHPFVHYIKDLEIKTLIE